MQRNRIPSTDHSITRKDINGALVSLGLKPIAGLPDSMTAETLAHYVRPDSAVFMRAEASAAARRIRCALARQRKTAAAARERIADDALQTSQSVSEWHIEHVRVNNANKRPGGICHMRDIQTAVFGG